MKPVGAGQSVQECGGRRPTSGIAAILVAGFLFIGSLVSRDMELARPVHLSARRRCRIGLSVTCRLAAVD